MNNNLEKKSLRKLQKSYQSVKAPDWLLQDTIQKAEQQQDRLGFRWAAPLFVGFAALILVVIILPQQSVETGTTLKSPSFADLDISKAKPQKFHLPGVSISSSFKGRIPTMPKSPIMPKQIKQSSMNTKHHSLSITDLYFYKEINKHV